MTIIKYHGETYAGFIVGESDHYGERFVEVQIIGFLTTKCLHINHLKSNVTH